MGGIGWDAVSQNGRGASAVMLVEVLLDTEDRPMGGGRSAGSSDRSPAEALPPLPTRQAMPQVMAGISRAGRGWIRKERSSCGRQKCSRGWLTPPTKQRAPGRQAARRQGSRVHQATDLAPIQSMPAWAGFMWCLPSSPGGCALDTSCSRGGVGAGVGMEEAPGPQDCMPLLQAISPADSRSLSRGDRPAHPHASLCPQGKHGPSHPPTHQHVLGQAQLCCTLGLGALLVVAGRLHLEVQPRGRCGAEAWHVGLGSRSRQQKVRQASSYSSLPDSASPLPSTYSLGRCIQLLAFRHWIRGGPNARPCLARQVAAL